MIVGLCEVRLRVPGARSLKEKRSLLRPLLTRLRQRFNVSVAEVGEQDKWQVAEVALACVASDSKQAHRQLEQVMAFIEGEGNVEVMEASLQLI